MGRKYHLLSHVVVSFSSHTTKDPHEMCVHGHHRAT
jgi:hypothetical protein